MRSDLATPPPQTGRDDAYIVADGAVGAWTGHVGEIARDASKHAWKFEAPEPGWQVYDQAKRETMLYHSGQWWPAADQAGIDQAKAAAEAALAEASAASATASAVQNQMNALQPAVSALQSRVDALEPAVAAVQAGVSAVQARVDTLQPAVAALQGDVSNVQSDVTQLRGNVDGLEARTSGLEGAMSVAQADIAALQASSGSSFPPSAYFGRVTPGIGAGPWNSTTYVPIIGGPIASFEDGVQNRISRSDSVFTFMDAGTYLLNLSLPAVAGSFGFVSVRLRGSVGGVLTEHATQVGQFVAYFPAALIVAVAADEEVTLEYAVSGATSVYTPGPTIDGQVTSVGHIAIHRLY